MKKSLIILVFLALMPACAGRQPVYIDKPFNGMFALKNIRWGMDRFMIEQAIGRKLDMRGDMYFIDDKICGKKCRIEFTVCEKKGLVSTRALFTEDLSKGEAVCVMHELEEKYKGDMEQTQWVIRDGVIHFMLGKGMNAVYINRLDGKKAAKGFSEEIVNCR